MLKLIFSHKITVKKMTTEQEKIPTIGLGPGTPKYLHTPKEHLPIKELIAARDIYAAIPYHLIKRQ